MNKEKILKILVDWNCWGNYKDESTEKPSYLKRPKAFLKMREIVVVKGVRKRGKFTICPVY